MNTDTTLQSAEKELDKKVNRLMGGGIPSTTDATKQGEQKEPTEYYLYINSTDIMNTINNSRDSITSKGFIRCERNGVNVLEQSVECILTPHNVGESKQLLIRLNCK